MAAVVYGVAALRLTCLTAGRLQAALAVVSVAGVAGNAGVAVNTLHVAYGHPDLFDLEGVANGWKMAGFFFPLTLLLAGIALRRTLPPWLTGLLVAGAVLFPVAHVADVSVLAILDGLLLCAALTGVWWHVSRLDTDRVMLGDVVDHELSPLAAADRSLLGRADSH